MHRQEGKLHLRLRIAECPWGVDSVGLVAAVGSDDRVSRSLRRGRESLRRDRPVPAAAAYIEKAAVPVRRQRNAKAQGFVQCCVDDAGSSVGSSGRLQSGVADQRPLNGFPGQRLAPLVLAGMRARRGGAGARFGRKRRAQQCEHCRQGHKPALPNAPRFEPVHRAPPISREPWNYSFGRL